MIMWGNKKEERIGGEKDGMEVRVSSGEIWKGVNIAK